MSIDASTTSPGLAAIGSEPRSTPTGGLWRDGAIFALIYFLGAELGHWLSMQSGRFATFWPPSGIYLAAMLLCRRPGTAWPILAGAALLADQVSDVLLHGKTVPVSLGLWMANTMEVLTGAWILRRWQGKAFQVRRSLVLRQLMGMAIVTAALSAPLGAAAGALVVSRAYGGAFLSTWHAWWSLAMLGHELRNPLTPICNAVALLRLRGGQDATVVRARDMIDRQARHLVRLVDDLLDIGRITRGTIRLERETVNMSEVVAAALECSQPLLMARRHTLEVAMPPASEGAALQVVGDRTRLAQVVTNLLNNAAKYTDEGGHVWLRLGRDGDCVELSVRDDGPGIPADMLPRIFDLFIQVGRTLDRAQGGLGSGLTLVRRIVEMHGGTVIARSEGRGSEFCVRLPGAPTTTLT
jgi:signal transduction histidine kinase